MPELSPIESKLPQHKCSLTITHNNHRDFFMSAARYVAENPSGWLNDEARNRAIETDELWEMQWYPDTPNGFIKVYAPTLSELLEMAKEKE